MFELIGHENKLLFTATAQMFIFQQTGVETELCN